MIVYVNGMGGGIGQFLWPRLERRGAVRMAASGGEGRLACDLSRPDDADGRWFAPGDVLVFAAAWSKPDQCRKDPSGAWRVNVENTVRLIGKALETGVTVFFFSSDTVYGSQEGTLAEDAPLLATEEYGRMKAEVERRFAAVPGFTALRLSYVLSPFDGVTRRFAQCAREGAVAEAFVDYARNMVWIGDVCAAVCSLIDAAARGEALPRAVNVGGPACVTRAETAHAYRHALAPALRIAEVAAPEGFFAARPRRIALDVSLFTRLLGRAPLTPGEAYLHLQASEGAVHV